MALVECIISASFCAVILGTPIPLLAPSGGLRASHNERPFLNTSTLSLSASGNPTSDCPAWNWNSVSWTLLAVIFFLALIATCFCKDKCKNSQSRDDIESRRIIPEKRKISQYGGSEGELIEENDELKAVNEILKIEKEFSDARFYRVDVILDPRTAHPKLKVSEDGKSVWNTGTVSKVSDCEERFDSHTFILAKRGFLEGKYYWEVEIGQKKTWDLGVASAKASRKGEITLSPENGYWVIGCDDGKDYWARTEQWTRLKVNGKLKKLGIFLDISAGSLSFYDVSSQRKLHTYKTLGSGELYPFFSTGSVTADLDSSPLRILPLNLEE
ncbi:butyrophilin subfamily 3 member A1-like isoform X1 [Zootoca vivipara]|uniref:butyrophilin subfamily 3 member A1-like isoform X1 n=1 Tax=Zootoca vivipara TaxID=8524 RepID=UPI0015917CD1|nr:butyrophilin subfamily 3 member A1-like isoform X1 [Zootoca vivipara]XP_034991922.1 butyrophilin subfamily 3 member A1-like [Zootoca vivipara]XP_034991923.1 butyrophilin subfamily 3 member A1-like [Zootoca vivipara]XP_034991924.1 butyrophilin subfamily 3 member A1-like [Zootoca vivipara]XP_034991925.1 butyrophilin subfamily 3 member A1-like [Zootoca vivipara]XP_034991927.1 butyrophilin subfamily 3 member A1-like isoform X1 [Zootoca vivipara]XP_034991928.1 butyrophilin subfamily 3 member A1